MVYPGEAGRVTEGWWCLDPTDRIEASIDGGARPVKEYIWLSCT